MTRDSAQEQAQRLHDRSLSSPQERFGERLKANASAEVLQARLMETEVASLANTFEHLTESGALPAAAAVLLGARRRYIVGAGKSSAYAALLGADLSATLSNVFVVDGHALSELTVLTDVRASDVLVLFTMRRYREKTVRFGRLFAEAGGSLIVIADSEQAPLAQLATSLVIVNTGSASYADSPTSVAAICHVLSALTASSAKGARRRLALRDEISETLGLYHSEPVPATDQQTTVEALR
ncbi:MurR/RpiR family transcriptional regulator [Pseudoclavibacter soli]|uniref:MurR/RpiR family transcriptional regulator n=1 Tax=Pseudoclavibacter soli TaxID=452623 RepID=UPI000416DB4A|nr:SIS domain-containing protein [Pseudoclavibacter soli]